MTNRLQQLCLLLLSYSTVSQVFAQTYTETFENITPAESQKPTSFTNNGQAFSLINNTDCSVAGLFGVYVRGQGYVNCNSTIAVNVNAQFGIGISCPGQSCNGFSSNFIDNSGIPEPIAGQSFSIKTTNRELLTVKSFYLYASTNEKGVPLPGGVTIIGMRRDSAIFTIRKDSGLNTDLGVNLGWTYIDLSREAPQLYSPSYSLYNIDELRIVESSSVKYVAIDNFRWSMPVGPITFKPTTDLVESNRILGHTNVMTNGATTAISFERSFSSSFEDPVSVAGSPSSVPGSVLDTTVNATFEGLISGRYYVYRLKAVNNFGVSYSVPDTVQTLATLPVQLISFETFSTSNKSVTAKWTTTAEVNNRQFMLERSYDGIHYELRKIMPAELFRSGAKTYSYTDENGTSGQSFYRLKQMDLDGKTSILGVRTVTLKNFSNLLIFPNPVNTGTFTIIRSEMAPKDAAYRLTDMTGSSIQSGVIRGKKQVVTISAVGAGNYLLQVSGEKPIKINKK